MLISDWRSDVCSSDLMLVESVKEEFGTDGLMSNVERFIEAERADFHWDGRLAEMNLGAYESFDEEGEAFELVSIVGYFRSRYYVATCVVDAERHVRWMLRLTNFDSFERSEENTSELQSLMR